jgi:hypothetical protein
MNDALPQNRDAGRYRIEVRIHASDRSTILRARDLQRSETVVLKSFDGSARSACLHEAAVALDVRHPNLLTCRDTLLRADEDPCLVFDYMRAGTLRDRITRGPLDAAAVVRLAARLLDGLEALHDAGWLHCDLKPANIFLGDGAPPDYLIGDLGSARGIATIEGHRFAGGTPAYSAPETLSRPHEPASDLYSLGLVLLEARCGEPPLTGSIAELRRHHRRGEVDLARIPESPLRAFVAALVEPDPRDRPTDCAGARHLLEGLTPDLAGTAPPNSGLRTLAAPVAPGLPADLLLPEGDPPRAIHLLRPGNRILLVLEHAHHLDLVDAGRPGTRRSIPLRDGLMRGGDRTILYRSHRQLLRHDLLHGCCASLLEADPAETLIPCEGRILRFHQGRLRVHAGDDGRDPASSAIDAGAGAAPNLPRSGCSTMSGGFAFTGGHFGNRVLQHDARGHPRHHGTLPGPVLALVASADGLHALALGPDAGSRQELWHLPDRGRPVRLLITRGIHCWNGADTHLDLLTTDGELIRIDATGLRRLGRPGPGTRGARAIALDDRASLVAVLAGGPDGRHHIRFRHPDRGDLRCSAITASN